MVVGEIVPGVAVSAVVFADRPPLSLAQVRSPFFPGDVCLARVVQPLLLGDVYHGIHFFWPPQRTGPPPRWAAPTNVRHDIRRGTVLATRSKTAIGLWS